MAKSAVAQIMDENSVGGKIKSWPTQIKTFYTEVRMEMKRVTTPTWTEVQTTTAVVIITVFLFAAYFWLVDNAIGQGLDRTLRYFSHR